MSAPQTPTHPWHGRPGPIALAGVALSLQVAALARGRVHQDEVFQFLEPAHYLALGDWMPAWEWSQGLRNWAVPGLLGGLFKLLALLGARHPWVFTFAAWVACSGAQAFATWALFRLVEERDDRRSAVLAAWAHVAGGGYLVYAARPLGDSLSVAAMLPALLMAWRARTGGSLRAGLLCGVFLGAAFVIRYPSGVFGIPVGVSLLWHRRWRALAATFGGGLLVVAGLGMLDWLTWGRPLHTVWAYFDFNILSGVVGGRFGTRPWHWNLPVFAGMAPMLLGYHFVRGLARRDLVVGTFATYFVVFSALEHKEARFLVPLIPLFVVIAAAGARRDLDRLYPRFGTRRTLGVVLSAFILFSIAGATVQTPFGLHADIIDATVEVGRRPELTGLVIAGPPEWNTGGRHYLASGVPGFLTYHHPEEPWRERLEAAETSHVLVVRDALEASRLEAAGFAVQTRWGKVALWRRGSPSATVEP